MECEVSSGPVLGLSKQERPYEDHVSALGRRPIGPVGAPKHAGRHSDDQGSGAREETGESSYTGGFFQR